MKKNNIDWDKCLLAMTIIVGIVATLIWGVNLLMQYGSMVTFGLMLVLALVVLCIALSHRTITIEIIDEEGLSA